MTQKNMRIGEGTRERKPSKYGEGGRALGGEAARHKPGVTAKLKPATPKALPRKPTNAPPSGIDGMPEPGGHPGYLQQQAKAVTGRPLPRDNPFAALKAAEAKRLGAPTGLQKAAPKATSAPIELDQAPDELIDDIFSKSPEEQRPTRAPEATAELGRKMRHRLPILAAEPEAATVEGEEPTPEGAKAGKLTPYTAAQAGQLAAIMGLPGVNCNRCPAMEHCPEAKENAECAFEQDFAGLTTRDTANILPALESIADVQLKRARRAVFLEARMTGGMLDPNVSRQLQVAFDTTERVAKLKGEFAPPAGPPTQRLTFEATSTGAPQQGGILSTLVAAITGAPTAPPALPAQPAAIDVVETQGEERRE